MSFNNISVCIPLYRKENIFTLIENLKKQKFQNFELIIGDDSNGEEIESIIKKSFPKVIYFKNHPPLGEVENSNKCFSKATKKWICLYHDDDLLAGNFLVNVITSIKNNPDIEIIYTGRLMIDEGGEVIGKQLIQGQNVYYTYRSEHILDYLLLGKSLPTYIVSLMTPGTVFKTSLLKKVGGFDKRINTHCDTDFILKLLSVSKKTIFINKELYYSGVWFGSSGRTKSSENGTVYWAQKGVINNFILFCREQGLSRYLRNTNAIYKQFARKCIEINGPIIWVRLRFMGKKLDEISILLSMLIDIIRLNPYLLVDVKLYLISLVALFVPKSLIQIFHKAFLRNYLSTVSK